jgi:cytidylate kinase
MQIVCVSRGTYSGGRRLAEKLAAKLGSHCMAREDLTEAATRAGIPVGKLEMAVVRRRPLTERMAIEKERFKAFVTATLVEHALKQDLVYHGRTGHLVLPGILQTLRVRAIMDPENRIDSVIQRLSLSRKKAIRYIEEVDEDRRRWVRSLYNLDWEYPGHYDVVINLSRMNVDNAASALVSASQLPEFQPTPATQRALEDLYLAARCRLAIGADQRTWGMDVQVSAERGMVSVTYLPRDEKPAALIPEVLSEVDGVNEIICTMASANLLWVQERYDPESESLTNILDIAGKWNAAVELVRLVEWGGDTNILAEEEGAGGPADTGDQGGILDDTAIEDESVQEEGFKQTRSRLISAGRAGGYRVVAGGGKEVLNSLDRTAGYSLVVVGDVFLSKAESVRKRLSREMVAYLSDNLRVPVIESNEMKTQYLFGAAQWFDLFKYAAAAAALFLLIFTHQSEVLTFLSREGTQNRILGTVSLFLFVPVFAYVYGNFARHLLRLLRFE